MRYSKKFGQRSLGWDGSATDRLAATLFEPNLGRKINFSQMMNLLKIKQKSRKNLERESETGSDKKSYLCIIETIIITNTNSSIE